MEDLSKQTLRRRTRLEITGLRSTVPNINKLAGGLPGGDGRLRGHGSRRTQHLNPWDLRRMRAVCGAEKMLEERVVEKERVLRLHT